MVAELQNRLRNNLFPLEFCGDRPSAARLRSRFGAASLHPRDQFVAVMFELLVADASFETPVDRIRRIAMYLRICHKLFVRL
jgi:hypothetical protein